MSFLAGFDRPRFCCFFAPRIGGRFSQFFRANRLVFVLTIDVPFYFKFHIRSALPSHLPPFSTSPSPSFRPRPLPPISRECEHLKFVYNPYSQGTWRLVQRQTMVFPTFIPFYEDEYKLKLRKLSDRALNGAYRQLKTRMASAVTGGDDVGVFLATHKVGLAVHRRRIGVRDQKLDMIKDEFHRRCLSVPSMRLWDIASGFGRGKITAGFESAGGFHNGVDDENVMRTDDYDDDYYDADYYGEDDYYDDYYDDGGYKYYEFSHSNLSSNYLYCPTR